MHSSILIVVQKIVVFNLKKKLAAKNFVVLFYCRNFKILVVSLLVGFLKYVKPIRLHLWSCCSGRHPESVMN